MFDFTDKKREEITLFELSQRTNIKLLGWYDKDYDSAYALHEHLRSVEPEDASWDDLKLLSALIYASDLPLMYKIRYARDGYQDWLNDSIKESGVKEPLAELKLAVVDNVDEYIAGKRNVDQLWINRAHFRVFENNLKERFGERVFDRSEVNTPDVQRILDAFELGKCLLKFAVFLRAAEWQKFWSLMAYDRDCSRTLFSRVYTRLRSVQNLYDPDVCQVVYDVV